MDLFGRRSSCIVCGADGCTCGPTTTSTPVDVQEPAMQKPATAIYEDAAGHRFRLNADEAALRGLGDDDKVRDLDVAPPPPPDVATVPDGDVEEPAKNASHDDWVAYAVSQGADAADAEELGRDELVELYGSD